MRIEQLEARHLLAISPLAPLIPAVGELGALVYRTSATDRLDAEGQSDSFSLALDANQLLSITARPLSAEGLTPRLEISDPAGQPLASVDAGAADAPALIQTLSTTAPGAYRFDVSSLAGGGDYELIVRAGTAVEEEAFGGAANDDLASAQAIDGSSVTLPGGADRLAVSGRLEGSEDWFAFDLSAGETAQLALATGDAAPLFSAPQGLIVQGGPIGVAIGDMNGDGRPDIVTANEGRFPVVGEVSVLLQNVDGTFAAPQSMAVGDRLFAFALGNFNTDAHLDVVVASYDLDNVTVLFGAGDGTFSSTLDLAVGDGPIDVAVDDIDADGAQDIVTTNALSSPGTVSILYGVGDGTFEAQVTHEVGDKPRGVRLGDLNGDDHLDLVVTGEDAAADDDAVIVLLGDGSRGFGAPTSFATGVGPRRAAIADVDNDGHLDVITANSGPSNGFPNVSGKSVSVLLGDGTGNLGGRRDVATQFGPTTLAVGDVNQDGALDIVTNIYGQSADGESVWVMLGRGDGTFASDADRMYQTGPSPQAVVLGDLDQDGDLDIVTADDRNGYPDYGVSILRGRSSAQLELLDAAGVVVGTGNGAATNAERTIDGFTAAAGGTYYARVSGDAAADYTLAVVRGAGLDLEPNDDVAAGQLPASGVVLGTLRGTAQPPANNGVEIEPNNNVAAATEARGAFALQGPNSLWTRLTGSIANFSDRDFFRIHAGPGDEFHIVRGGGGQGGHSVSIVDNQGAIVAGATGGSFSSIAILNYTLPENAYTGDYYISATYLSTIRTGSYSITVEQRAGSRYEVADRDVYEIELVDGQQLTLSMLTPADDPDQPSNDADPVLELFDATGTLVASDDNGASDGRNARLVYEVPAGQGGTYRVRVTPADPAAIGDYVLVVGDGAAPTLEVLNTSPTDGAFVTAYPATVRVELSQAVDPASVDAAELTIDGTPADAVRVIDHATLEFDFTNAAQGDGEYEIAIADGAMAATGGATLSAYAARFTVDTVHPTIVAASVASGEVLTSGNLTFTFEISEPLHRVDLGPEDVTLVEQLVTGASFAPSAFRFDEATNTIEVSYAALPEGQYLLALVAGADAIRDRAGLGLDGTGSGTQSADFTVDFSLDAATSPFGAPLVPVAPLGSWVHEGTLGGLMHAAGDVDRFTVELDDIERLSAVATPQDAALQLAVRVFAPGGALLAEHVTSAAGTAANVASAANVAPGTYTVEVESLAGSGLYALRVATNANIEREVASGANDTAATAEDIAGSAVMLGGGASRMAVLGTASDAADVYRFTASAGDRVSIALAPAERNAGLFAAGQLPQVDLGGGEVRTVATGDLDGDGRAEVLVGDTDGNVTVLNVDAAGNVAVRQTVPVSPGGDVAALVVGDIDGDGDLDVVAGAGAGGHYGGGDINAHVLLNDAGTLGAGDDQGPVPGFRPIWRLADVDGQNGLDLIASQPDDEMLFVRRRQSDGTFGPEETTATTGRIIDFVVGDIDGDGDLDIAASTYTGYAGYYSSDVESFLEVLLSNGDGTFTPAGMTPTHVLNSSLAAGDLDGDGDIDIAVGGCEGFVFGGACDPSNTLSVTVFRSSSDGSVQRIGDHTTPLPSRALAIGDINGDGRGDIFSVGTDQAPFSNATTFIATALINRGDGSVAQSVHSILPGEASVALLSDVDGDGVLDFVGGPSAVFDDHPLSIALGRGTLVVELLDAAGTVVATGVRAAGRIVIDDFAPPLSGDYFVRVASHGAADYALVAAIDASLDREPNAVTSPQDIRRTPAVAGHLAALEPFGSAADGVLRVAIIGGGDGQQELAAALGHSDEFLFNAAVFSDVSTIESVEALRTFDVIILPSGSFDGDFAAFGAALRGWVEEGGALITTDRTTASMSSFSQGIEDYDAIIPVDAASTDSFEDTFRVSPLAPDHPVLQGIGTFDVDVSVRYPDSGVLDDGAVVLAEGQVSQVGPKPLLVEGTFGLGRTIWTGLNPFFIEGSAHVEALWRRLVAYMGGGGEDAFTFTVAGEETLILSTTTPGFGTRADHTLDPRLELYNALGFLVATDDNSAGDGRNALVVHQVPAGESGTYRVVVGRSGGEGDYGLSIGGMTIAASDPATVTETYPADGAKLSGPPVLLDIAFSDAIRADSLDVGDLTIDGGATVLGVSMVDGRTVRFALDVPNAAAVYSYSLAGGAFVDVQQQASVAYAGTFEIDRTGPRLVAQTPAVQAAAPFNTITFTFDEAIAPGAYDETLFESFQRPDGGNLTFSIRDITAVGNQLIVEFFDQTQLGTYTFVLDAAKLTDVAGNPLDQDQNGTGGETTDDYSGAVTIQSMDLTVEAFAPALGSAEFGGALSLAWTVRNIGGDPAVEGWVDRVWLSADDTFSPQQDIQLGSFSADDIVPLASDGTYMRTVDVTLPLSVSLTPGTFHLFVETDATKTQAELNETNNTATATVDLALPLLPDLAISNVELPATAFSNQNIDVTWTVTNNGDAPATGTWTDHVFLSADAAAGGDQFYGAFPFTGSLAPGQSIVRTQSIFLPFNVTGQHFAVVVGDATNTVFEHALDANNTTVSTGFVTVTQSLFPDLRTENVTTAATDVELNTQPFTVDWVVRNSGTGPTSAPFWTDYVYLSSDTVLDASDRFIGSTNNQSYLAVGDAYGSSAVVTATGVPAGDYYILVKADATNPDRVEEFIAEDNNVGVGPRISVRLPPPPDMIVTNVAAPPLGLSGQPISIAYSVENVGPGGVNAGSWVDRVYLSADLVFDATDALLGSFTRLRSSSLGGPPDNDVEYTSTVNVTLPIGVTGEFHVLVQTDATNRINEFAFEQNNFTFDESPLQISLTPPPDLVVETINVPATGEAGHAIDMEYTAFNRGATAVPNGPWRDALYLSLDETFDASDIFLRELYIYGAGLGVDASYTRATTVTIPNGLSGDYFVLVRSDRLDQVFEIDNVNNVAASPAPISIGLFPPDLVVSSFAHASTGIAGEAMSVSWTVANQGTGDTIGSSWIDRVYLSTDDVPFPNSDRLLDTFNHVGKLDAGEAYTVTRTIGIPFDVSGDVFLYVFTDHFVGSSSDSDGAISEFAGEANNVATLSPLSVTRRTPDLEITPTTLANENGRLRVEWSVANVGDNVTNTSYWYDAVVASANDTYGDADDVLLRQEYRSGRLEPTQSYVRNRLIDVPYSLGGTQHIFFVTDYENRYIDEGGAEANNVALAGLLDVDAMRTHYDFVLAGVDAADEATSGQFFDVTWTVRNVGAPLGIEGPRPVEAGGGVWTDNVYLSRDQVFDPATDTFLGQASTGIASLNLVDDGGTTYEEYQRTASLRMPAGFTGPFYVFVQVDRGSHIVELGAEGNNVDYDLAPVFVSLAPPVDLVAGEVTVPAAASLGAIVSLTFTLHNDGDTAASGFWTDRMYLSADAQYSPDDVRLAPRGHSPFRFPTPDAPVPAHGSETFEYTAVLPPMLPGEYFLVLRTDIFNVVPESNEENNLSVSLDRVSIDVPEIAINDGTGSEPFDLTLGNQQTRVFYYRFDALDGQTLSLDANFIDIPDEFVFDPDLGQQVLRPVPRQTVVSAYLARGRVPTPFDYDLRQDEMLRTFEHFHTEESLIVPRTREGTYYLRVEVRDTHPRDIYNPFQPILGSQERFDLAISVLPFRISSLEGNTIGNAGPATTTVVASNFTACTAVELLFGGAPVRSAQHVERLGDDTALVTFDYSGLPVGDYEVRVTDHTGASDTETISIVDGAGSRVGGGITGPSPLRRASQYAFYATYGNSGDADGIAPLLLMESGNETAWGLTRETQISRPTLQALGISLEGPAGILRPGELGSVPVYFTTLSAGEPAFQVHTITADDPRPLVFAEIEPALRPTDMTDDAWNELRPKLIERIGPTWGSYVRALAETATSLSNVGLRVSDASILLSEMMRQAADPYFSPFGGSAVAAESCLPVEAPVVLAIAETGEAATAVVLGNGDFTFPGLPQGSYTLIAEAPGRARSVVLDVDVGAAAAKQIVSLPVESRIEGRVTLDAQGPAVGTLTVLATLRDALSPAAATFTVETSSLDFSLGGLPAGEYDLAIGRDGAVFASAFAAVSAGETVDVGAIALDSAGGIEGQVTVGAGVLDPAHTIVRLLAGGELVSTTPVSATGEYAFFDLTPGEYSLRVEELVAQPRIGSEATVVVVGNEFNVGVDLVLAEGGVITGVVSDAAAMQPLAVVPVQLLLPTGEVRATFTDNAGRYRFDGLSMGDYVVMLPAAPAAGAANVTVDAIDEAEFTADLAYTPAATLTGVVTDGAGAPLEGATVRLSNDDGFIIGTRTDSAGRYTFLLAAPGTFDLEAIGDGATFAPAADISISAGQVVEHDFAAGQGSLRVNVADGFGNVEGVHVLLKQVRTGPDALAGTAIVDASGFVEFGNLIAGTYAVEVIASDGRGALAEIAVPGSGQTNLSVDVAFLRHVQGTITGAGGNPVAQGTVLLVSTSDPQDRRFAPVLPDGTYEFLRVAVGSYALVVIADGYATHVESVVVESTNTSLLRHVALADATTSIAGRAVDATGTPLPSGFVQVTDAAGVIVDEVAIGDDGTFELTGAVGDDLTLTASAIGFAPGVVAGVSAAGGPIDLGDVMLAAAAISQGTGAVAPQAPPASPSASSALVAFQAIAAGAPADAGLFPLLTAVGLPVFLFGVYGADVDRRPDEVTIGQIPDRPAGSCVACADAELDAINAEIAQDPAYAVVEARDDDLDWQLLALPAAYTLEMATNLGAIATLIVAGVQLAAAFGVGAAGASASAALAGLSTTTSVGFTIAQTIPAIDGLVNIVSDFANAQTAEDLATKLNVAFGQSSNIVQAVTAAIDAVLGVLSAAGAAGSVATAVGTASSSAGGVGNLIGLAAGFAGAKSLYVNTFTLQATRDQVDLIIQYKEYRDNARDAYYYVVDYAHYALNAYLYCLQVHQDDDPTCDFDDDDNGGGNGGDPNDGPPPTPNPNDTPTPPVPPTPPSGYFPGFVVSADPNDILGPAGFGEEKWVTLRDPLAYTIRFENMADASAPAMLVTITQQLDDDLDFRTFRVDDFGFGETQIELNATQPFFTGRVPLEEGSPYVVDVIATIDVVAGLVTWIFQTIDPSTGDPPLDALAGFLPPNDATRRGEGFVSYTVKPKPSAATGSRVDAQATIVFDDNEPIDTPPIFNTLDAAAPTSTVEPISNPTGSETFNVRWAAGDDAGGSALSAVDVYVSRDGRPFEPWLVATTLTEAPYVGALGHSYAFYSVARDNAGNAESLPTSPDATTSVPFPGLFGDVNGDGKVGIADLIRIRNNQGLAGTASHNDGDLSGDRRVNMEDIAAFLAVFGASDAGGGSPAAAEAVVVAAAPNWRDTDTPRALRVDRDANVRAASRKATRRAASDRSVDAALASLAADDSVNGTFAHRRMSRASSNERVRRIVREVDSIFGESDRR